MQHRVKMWCMFLSVTAVSVRAFEASGNIKFPENFMLGAATAAYQIEGAWNESGKGPNIWDTLTHKTPKKISDLSNGDVASDSYHLYKEDVQLLKNLGVDFYRFSISWSRILPTGLVNKVNQAGIDYYNNLINELRNNNLEPVITMYHWDLPQPLQDLGGWANPVIAEYFEDYAHVLFTNFGDRVKWWITLNEPINVALGYATETEYAPAVNAPGIGNYMALHTILIAHANAYHLYDKRFRKKQQGKVGITLNSHWFEPLHNVSVNWAASERALQFVIGSFAHPIYSSEGDYPEIVKEMIAKKSKEGGFMRSRLPAFTREQVKHIKGTGDFFGINHYSTTLIQHNENSDRDSDLEESVDPTWPTAASDWLHVFPSGFRKLLLWIKNEYNNPPVFVTENGFSDRGDLHDIDRTKYHISYMAEMLKAIKEDGCNVFGYTAWSLIDNFEWMHGYTQRFGLYYVNFSDPARRRIPKDTTFVFAHIARTRQLPIHLVEFIEEDPKKEIAQSSKSAAASPRGIPANYITFFLFIWLVAFVHLTYGLQKI